MTENLLKIGNRAIKKAQVFINRGHKRPLF